MTVAIVGGGVVDDKWKYGLVAVIAGLLAIVGLVVVAMFRYSSAEVNNVVGTALGAIGTLVGAYSGCRSGRPGRNRPSGPRTRPRSGRSSWPPRCPRGLRPTVRTP